MNGPARTDSRLPAGIWALGFVSLLMDISSELIHSLLPVFMVTTLGASMLVVGLVEGAAEATALVVKVFSGALSDYWGRRKPLAVLGYAMGAASKPLFALAASTGMVVVVAAADAAATAATLRAAGEAVHEIGVIAARGEGASVLVG
ncbi:MAG TPA: MFS transporter [Ramlibacter sp.]|nr:MFS transporter [Ramlibacter sp.]